MYTKVFADIGSNHVVSHHVFAFFGLILIISSVTIFHCVIFNRRISDYKPSLSEPTKSDYLVKLHTLQFFLLLSPLWFAISTQFAIKLGNFAFESNLSTRTSTWDYLECRLRIISVHNVKDKLEWFEEYILCSGKCIMLWIFLKIVGGMFPCCIRDHDKTMRITQITANLSKYFP